MRPEDLWQQYPVLYHIAWGRSWPSIKEHGLLSTKALLRSYGKSEDQITALSHARRQHWVEIDCPSRPRAVLRDQKPLTDAGLRRALPDSVEPWQWYDLINSMVFFWPTAKRLKTMISASAYHEVEQDVLLVDTKTLVQLEQPDIRLSRMNSGSTKRMAHPRDLDLFKRFEEYPFSTRRKKQGRERAVAEVCVIERVDRIRDAVTDVKRGLPAEILEALT